MEELGVLEQSLTDLAVMSSIVNSAALALKTGSLTISVTYCTALYFSVVHSTPSEIDLKRTWLYFEAKQLVSTGNSGRNFFHCH